MAKITQTFIKAEDFEKEDQELVSKLSFILNPVLNQLAFAFNKNITIDDNLNAEFKSITLTVNEFGIPIQESSITTSIPTRLKGCIVVSAYPDLTNYSKKFNKTITNISATDPSIITLSSDHDLKIGDYISIENSDSTPSIDGTHQVIPISSTKVQISKAVSGAGSSGNLTLYKNLYVSAAPFITFLQTDRKININNVTGLQSGIKYTLNLLILG